MNYNTYLSCSLYLILPRIYTAYLVPIRFTLGNMDFTLDNIDFTLDNTEIHAADWSKTQSLHVLAWFQWTASSILWRHLSRECQSVREWRRYFRSSCRWPGPLRTTVRWWKFINKMPLINWFRIGLVTGPWSAVLVLGLQPRTYTADLDPVTEPIRNRFINNIILF